jgi:polar amino acid transport system substrate-binding protein
MRRIIVAFLLIAGWLVADGADVTIAANAEARQILAPSGVLRAGLYTGAPSGLPSQFQEDGIRECRSCANSQGT